ncbi:MAG: hypothetical protein J5782_04240 [Clostridia bacterium]|nr:hypothetical protein [Clostridia bacterium]
MIDGNITEFIDSLYYGQEIVFIFKDKKYFIQGWWSEDRKRTTMVLTDVNDNTPGYLWKHEADSMIECAEAFLAAPIWDEKDFLQIQEDVIWSDW